MLADWWALPAPPASVVRNQRVGQTITASSIEADTIEEERRLAYVGITRARQNLAMTFAAKRKQYGEIIDCTPSRFLDELPPEDLIWEGQEDAPVEVKAARGNNALADIRAMLKRWRTSKMKLGSDDYPRGDRARSRQGALALPPAR